MFNVTKEGLKEALAAEKKIYRSEQWQYRLMELVKQTEKYQLWRYVRALRYCGYYVANKKKTVFHELLSVYWRRKVNVMGAKLGLMCGCMACDTGLTIYHYGNIVIDGNFGRNLKLHGDNCIGRNSLGGDDMPTLGDNVRLGVGAKVIGDIYIANDVTIAAGAVVTKSCYEEGATLAGVPARIIKRRNE